MPVYHAGLHIVIKVSDIIFHAKISFFFINLKILSAHTSVGYNSDINTKSWWKSISVVFCHKMQKLWNEKKLEKKIGQSRALSAHTEHNH